jgi:hypothetical protein
LFVAETFARLTVASVISAAWGSAVWPSAADVSGHLLRLVPLNERVGCMHYAGHLREAFLDWVDAGFPAHARVEVNYEQHTWPAVHLLRYMSGCSDIVPGISYAEVLRTFNFERPPKQTYASVASTLLPDFQHQVGPTARSRS